MGTVSYIMQKLTPGKCCSFFIPESHCGFPKVLISLQRIGFAGHKSFFLHPLCCACFPDSTQMFLMLKRRWYKAVVPIPASGCAAASEQDKFPTGSTFFLKRLAFASRCCSVQSQKFTVAAYQMNFSAGALQLNLSLKIPTLQKHSAQHSKT